MDDTSAAIVKVTGRVQGVFFRATASEVALSLGLSGWVRNLHDGSVELLIEGNTGTIQEMITWCNNGPPASIVSDVTVRWVSPSGIEGFRITW